MDDSFFVIGRALKRTRCATEEQAVGYAAQLIARATRVAPRQPQNKIDAAGGDKGPFFVVKLVKIVELAPQPVIVREATVSDFQSVSSEHEEDVL